MVWMFPDVTMSAASSLNEVTRNFIIHATFGGTALTRQS
jgi:hypothetical protein